MGGTLYVGELRTRPTPEEAAESWWGWYIDEVDPVPEDAPARLVWLEWRARWALAHCRSPAIGAV